MNVPRQSSAKGYGHLGLQELDHGVGVARTGAQPTPLENPPYESTAIPSDKVSHNLAIQPGHNQGEICPQHQEEAMAHEQASLLTVPPRDHNAQQAQELMQKRQIEARLRLRWWDLQRHLSIVEPSRAGWIEEEPSVGVEGGRFRRMDGDP